MSYYSERAKAYQTIDKLLAKKIPLLQIQYKIATEFGFTEKFVDKRIKMIEELTK